MPHVCLARIAHLPRLAITGTIPCSTSIIHRHCSRAFMRAPSAQASQLLPSCCTHPPCAQHAFSRPPPPALPLLAVTPPLKPPLPDHGKAEAKAKAACISLPLDHALAAPPPSSAALCCRNAYESSLFLFVTHPYGTATMRHPPHARAGVRGTACMPWQQLLRGGPACCRCPACTGNSHAHTSRRQSCVAPPRNEPMWRTAAMHGMHAWVCAATGDDD